MCDNHLGSFYLMIDNVPHSLLSVVRHRKKAAMERAIENTGNAVVVACNLMRLAQRIT
jgi:hypothetical protein